MGSNRESRPPRPFEAGDDLATALAKRVQMPSQEQKPTEAPEKPDSKEKEQLTRDEMIQYILDAGFIPNLSEQGRLEALDEESLKKEFRAAQEYKGVILDASGSSSESSDELTKLEPKVSEDGIEVTNAKLDQSEKIISSKEQERQAREAAREAKKKKGKPKLHPNEQNRIDDLNILKGKAPESPQAETRLDSDVNPETGLKPPMLSTEELRRIIKEKAEEPSPDWQESRAKLVELDKKHGIVLIEGFLTPDQHLELYKKLEEVLPNLPPEALLGLSIKFDNVKSAAYVPKNRKFVFPPTINGQEIEEYLRLKLRLPDKLKETEAKTEEKTVETLEKTESTEPVVSDPKVEAEPAKEPVPETLLEFQPEQPESPGTVRVERKPLETETDEQKLLEEKLNAARKTYVAAKKKFEEYGAIQKVKNKISGGPSAVEVHGQFNDLKLEYQKARQEYVGANIERYLAEKLVLAQAHRQEFGQMEAGHWRKYQDKWDKLMGANVGYFVKDIKSKPWPIKAAAKLMSLRTAVYACLTLSGIGAAGAMVSAVDVGFRSQKYTEMGRNFFKKKEATDQELADYNLDQVQNRLGALEASAYFDSKSLDEVVNTPQYQKLKAREKLLLEQEGFDPNDLEFLRTRANLSEDASDIAAIKERRIRRGVKVGSALFGMAVGFGVVGKVIESLDKKYDWGWGKGHSASTSELTSQAGAEAVKSGADINLGVETPEPAQAGEPAAEPSAAAEAPEPETSVSKGTPTREIDSAEQLSSAEKPVTSIEIAEGSGKSIESVMIDNVKNNPNGSTAKWLAEKYPGIDYKSAIHQRVLEIAKENGYSVDGSGKDLSDIVKAKINISSDGSFNLDKGNLDFAENLPTKAEVMGSVRHEVEATAERATEAAGKIGPENIEKESLDFDRIKEGNYAEVTQTIDTAKDTVEAGSYVSEDEINKLYSQVENEKKATDALKELLGGTKYKEFMKEINLDGKDLNKWQNQKLTNFLTHFTSNEISDKQILEFKGLADRITKLFDKMPVSMHETLRQESMKKIMVRLVAERMKQ